MLNTDDTCVQHAKRLESTAEEQAAQMQALQERTHQTSQTKAAIAKRLQRCAISACKVAHLVCTPAPWQLTVSIDPLNLTRIMDPRLVSQAIKCCFSEHQSATVTTLPDGKSQRWGRGAGRWACATTWRRDCSCWARCTTLCRGPCPEPSRRCDRRDCRPWKRQPPTLRPRSRCASRPCVLLCFQISQQISR